MRTTEDILLERLNSEDNGCSYSIVDGKLNVERYYDCIILSRWEKIIKIWKRLI